MLASLAQGRSVIKDYLAADDCMSTLEAFRAMGVKIQKTSRELTIDGAGSVGLKKPTGSINAGNSGTTVRLLSGILAGQNFSADITGDESLSKRPMKRVIEPLSKMGAVFSAKETNYLPMTVTGTKSLKPIDYLSPVASAQVKSSVLFAGLFASGITSVTEPAKSRDHTERMLRSCGAEIEVKGLKVSVKGPARLKSFNISVPGDISSAAFFMALAAISRSAKIKIMNVGINPTRDGIIEVFRRMNAKLKLSNQREISGEPVADIEIESSGLLSFEIDEDIMPRLIDEIPALVLCATQANGKSVISGAGELRVKESDRLKTISSELRKMGADIEEKDDGLIIKGPVKLKGAAVESYGDHRVAMTLAVAGLIAEGETTIAGVECVATSFPGFMEKIAELTK